MGRFLSWDKQQHRTLVTTCVLHLSLPFSRMFCVAKDQRWTFLQVSLLMFPGSCSKCTSRRNIKSISRVWAGECFANKCCYKCCRWKARRISKIQRLFAELSICEIPRSSRFLSSYRSSLHEGLNFAKCCRVHWAGQRESAESNKGNGSCHWRRRGTWICLTWLQVGSHRWLFHWILHSWGYRLCLNWACSLFLWLQARLGGCRWATWFAWRYRGSIASRMSICIWANHQCEKLLGWEEKASLWQSSYHRISWRPLLVLREVCWDTLPPIFQGFSLLKPRTSHSLFQGLFREIRPRSPQAID